MISNYKFNCTGVNLGIIYFWIYFDFSLMITFSFENIYSLTYVIKKIIKVKILSVAYILSEEKKHVLSFILFVWACTCLSLCEKHVCRHQMSKKSTSDNTGKDEDTVVNHIWVLDFEHDEYAMLSTAVQFSIKQILFKPEMWVLMSW